MLQSHAPQEPPSLTRDFIFTILCLRVTETQSAATNERNSCSIITRLTMQLLLARHRIVITITTPLYLSPNFPQFPAARTTKRRLINKIVRSIRPVARRTNLGAVIQLKLDK